MVERNFAVKIKAIQYDGGKDFSFITTYLVALGITHRVTCPHSSSKNGFVETQIQRVVERGLALLFHAKMPLKF